MVNLRRALVFAAVLVTLASAYFLLGYSETRLLPFFAYPVAEYNVPVSGVTLYSNVWLGFVDDDNRVDLVTYDVVVPYLKWCYVLSSGSSGCNQALLSTHGLGFYIYDYRVAPAGRYLAINYLEYKEDTSGSYYYRYFYVDHVVFDVLTGSTVYSFVSPQYGYSEYSSGTYYQAIGTDAVSISLFTHHVEDNVYRVLFTYEQFYRYELSYPGFYSLDLNDIMHFSYFSLDGTSFSNVGFVVTTLHRNQYGIVYEYTYRPTVPVFLPSSVIYYAPYYAYPLWRSVAFMAVSSSGVSVVGSVDLPDSSSMYSVYCAHPDFASVDDNGTYYLVFWRGAYRESNYYVCRQFPGYSTYDVARFCDAASCAYYLIDANLRPVSAPFDLPSGVYNAPYIHSCDFNGSLIACTVYAAPPFDYGFELNVLGVLSYDENVNHVPVELNLLRVLDRNVQHTLYVYLDGHLYGTYDGLETSVIYLDVNTPGDHVVSLVAESNSYVSSMKSASFHVLAKPWNLRLYYILKDNNLYLAATATDDDVNAPSELSYTIDVNLWFPTRPIQSYTFNAPSAELYVGSYIRADVCLTVTDPNNLSTTKCSSIDLTKPTEGAPAIVFGPPEVRSAELPAVVEIPAPFVSTPLLVLVLTLTAIVLLALRYFGVL